MSLDDHIQKRGRKKSFEDLDRLRAEEAKAANAKKQRIKLEKELLIEYAANTIQQWHAQGCPEEFRVQLDERFFSLLSSNFPPKK